MGPKLRQRLAALVTTILFALILWKVLERTFVIVWAQTPWWGLLILLVVLYYLISLSINRLFGSDS
ncbi:hypothetical protein [Meiothermus granaticius]|uniref:Uncharacterized protein n=1 Tax=Meiothermus granaticius NBRC 107808 TaxID=1227551 RepID=A0A399F8J6_9DEIN|nr:hypothetical protein [Meiothermus granaticius]MCL6526091.1 hypothetical protein [Thermaceae bacterium]RIH91996.1 hypothetical protein Mgrana_02069 [Meiothermus granaticius NBRC 107808]GEM86857.1 hypothetical protein MGR01S_14820 [Meiothermus granaticius NBRC 107808]